jgi:hypothetical protein
MQDDPTQSAAREEARSDTAVLELLITNDRLWSFEEVVLELGPRFTVEDAVARLHGAGLIHRLESFVFATRAAVVASRLD